MGLDIAKIPTSIGYFGTNYPLFPNDGEGPLQRIKVQSFKITTTAITNSQFLQFVKDTNYTTDAEKYGWSFVYRDSLIDKSKIREVSQELPLWCKIKDANWKFPKGQNYNVKNFDNLPVVHISWNDAQAYADWIEGRLPTEIEWEHAARGGLGDVIYPWGDEHPSSSDKKCNFGLSNIESPKADLIGPIDVKSFDSNGYGLYNMVGNVWEWTQTINKKVQQDSQIVLKGGSYLCHPKRCYRYRIASKIFNTHNTSTGHIGFRVVF
ncbi:MAG: sulfatase modifying factor 1 (C-alpha-formyglycine- generating enzyme 1) [Rickettsiales bacterium]|nr:sulfatase modifying factor 1 (C-alpha-formyglycine- generating enzyme 1) [Rickettsiales bacterium]|tara:strand:- start:75 stop:869 length:795 start_codon:yes stop_codon:yes gene_type:complete